jgi:hypothetical protein
MALKIPQKGLNEWVDELIQECRQSSEQRRDLIRMYRSYYYTGTSDGTVAIYNRCYPHVERLGAFLYSPTDVRFDIEFDETEEEATHAMGHAGARYLNRHFHRRNLDLNFADAVNGGLIDGCNILKSVWGHDGLEGWVIRPQFFGVLREDIDDLDRQEAFVHSTYMTPTAFERTIWEHPERKKIMEQIKSGSQNQKEQDEFDNDYFHQIIVGGTQPVSTTTSSGSGMVGIVGVPTPVLDAKVATSLVRLDELWVQDQERQDYTTIRRVNPNIIIEGNDRRRNLCGLTDTLGKNSEMKGFHPFVKVCPNNVEGFFWGQSEIAMIYRLQDSLNEQHRNIRRLQALRSDPPRSATGFAGMNLEKYKAFKRPGGFVSEENPTAKMTEHTPEIPPEIFTFFDKTIEMFDDVAGFTGMLKGEGEQGVRSNAQAQAMSRNASPRMRDRSLLVERQCAEWGEFNFRMLQAKDAEVQALDKKGGSFVLSQLPDDAKVVVDSHTSSPVYQEDAERKAFLLQKAGAIDAADLIMLTHPPHEDILRSRAKEREEAQQKLIQQHPELLTKGHHK